MLPSKMRLIKCGNTGSGSARNDSNVALIVSRGKSYTFVAPLMLTSPVFLVLQGGFVPFSETETTSNSSTG